MTTANPDVVIIGGGIVGIAAAYYLAGMGVRSTVIEKDGIASHASGFAYGGLSGGMPNGPQHNTAIIEYSMGLYPVLARALAEETDVDIQYQDRPLLRLALSDDEAVTLTRNLDWQQAQRGYKVEWLDPAAARGLEPRISSETVGALHVEGGSDVEPYRLTLALAQAAEKRGASIRTGEVTAIHHHDGKLLGVALGSEQVACGAVLVAMGPWSAQAESWFGMRLPVRPLKGQIIRLRAGGAPYALSIGHGSNYAMTKPSDGLVWCGTTEEEVGFDESKDDPGPRPDHRIDAAHAARPGGRGGRPADRLPAAGRGGRRHRPGRCPRRRGRVHRDRRRPAGNHDGAREWPRRPPTSS